MKERDAPGDAIPVVVAIRPWRASDAADYSALVCANYLSLAPVARWARSDFSSEDFLEWMAQEPANRSWKFGITCDGVVVGSLVADEIRTGCAELSFWLSTAVRGRGIMAHAIQDVEQVLISDGIQLVEIHAQVSNLASIEVARRSGYREIRRYDNRPSRPGVMHVVYGKRLSQ